MIRTHSLIPLIALISFSFSTVTYSQSEGNSQNYKDFTETWAGAYRRSVEARIEAEEAKKAGDLKAAKKAEEKAKKELDKANAALTKMKNRQDAETKALQNAQKQVEKYRAEQERLQAEFTRIYDASEASHLKWKGKTKFGRAFSKKPKDVKETDEIARQLAKLKLQHTELSSQISNLESSTSNREAEIQNAEAQIANVGTAISDLEAKTRQAEANKTVSPDFVDQASMAEAKLLFDEMKKDHYNAKFLMTRIEVLKANKKLTDVQINALKAQMDGQLNDTLLGVYINGQIKKGLSNICSLQAKCATQDAAGISSDIDRLLLAPGGAGDDVRITDENGSDGSEGTGDGSGDVSSGNTTGKKAK